MNMKITITDPEVAAQVEAKAGPIYIEDADGNILDVLNIPEGYGKLPPGVRSPFTEEERAEMRKERTGRPVKDILRDLEARG